MNFQIKNPCNENWNEMAVIGASRFCAACKSKVHDFSNASAKVIREQYGLNNGKICGRISKTLLREQFITSEVRKGYFHHLKIFCWAALLGFGASLFSIPAANAKGMISELRMQLLEQEHPTVADSALVKVKGIVKDKQNGELLPFVSVVLMVNDSAVMNCATDIDGNYEMMIDAEKYPVFDLKFMYVAYETVMVKNIRPQGGTTFVDTMMHTNMEAIEMGIIVEVPSHPIRDFFRSGKTVSRDEYKQMPKQ